MDFLLEIWAWPGSFILANFHRLIFIPAKTSHRFLQMLLNIDISASRSSYEELPVGMSTQ